MIFSCAMEATLDISPYLKKLTQIEMMVEEVKQGLAHFDKELQGSIEQGEKDIEQGKVTVCKTGSELDAFFASV